MSASTNQNDQIVEFSQEWKTWIWSSINRDWTKQQVFDELEKQGFRRPLIISELNYDPEDEYRVDPVSPKSPDGSTSAQYSGHHDIPIATPISHNTIKLQHIDNFLNKSECNQLISLIKENCHPSELATPDQEDKTFRTSQTTNLSHLDNAFVREIDERICKVMGIDPSYGEGIQGQFYRVGEEFKPHTDYFSRKEVKRHGKVQGQRTWTVMIYLNDVEAGGVTYFPKLDIGFQPKLGKTIIWNSLDEKGRPNAESLHHGKPVEAGEKFIITKWFRAKGEGPMLVGDPKESAPRYTAKGFKKCPIPAEIYQDLLTYYHDHKNQSEAEHIEGEFITGPNTESNSQIINLSDSLKQRTHNALQPIIEKWSRQSLEPTYVYGIREYSNGAALVSHRDRADTHIVSATLNIDQDTKQGWPLEIDDHVYRQHSIILKPGEMLLYESMTLLHSRVTPFKGQRHADIFVHFGLKPKLL